MGNSSILNEYNFKCVYCGEYFIAAMYEIFKIRPVETADSCGSCGRKAESTRVVLFEKKMNAAYRVKSIRIKIK